MTVLKSISFLRRNEGADDDGRVDLRSLSLARQRSDAGGRAQRRRGSVFHGTESASAYVEIPGEVWSTVKTGLLNEAFDRYCNIVLHQLGGDELLKDDYMKSAGQESRKATRRASMNEFTGDASSVPHFLDVLRTTYEENLSTRLHQDSTFIKLRRRTWTLLSEPDSSWAAMAISIFVLLTICLSSTIFCIETMEEDRPDGRGTPPPLAPGHASSRASRRRRER